MVNPKLRALWNHPAGPKTIHFWAPTFKWGLSIANVSDFSKPPEILSYPQQAVIATSGIIWSRYCFVIKPWNWNLLAVNSAMAATGFYQLFRKATHDYQASASASTSTSTSTSTSAEGSIAGVDR